MEPLSSKILIFIRHAHRDKSMGRDKDNGLSSKGILQAKAISAFYQKRFGKKKITLLSSKKIRCVETLEPIARKTKNKITISSLLLEEDKNLQSLKKRVAQFCEDWKKSNDPITMACSHGDWIPFAVKYLTGAFADCKKGSWTEIHFDKEKIFLSELKNTI